MGKRSSAEDDIARAARLERTTHDTPAGWWLSLAVVVVGLLCVEGLTRQLPMERLLFRGGDHGATVRPVIKAFLRAGPPPAEVVFFGSSRTHRGVVLSQVESMLDERGLGPVRARSYAFAGAHIQEIGHYIDALLNASSPRLVLIGVAPRALRGSRETLWADMTPLRGWWRRVRAGTADDAWDGVTLGGSLHHELSELSMAVSFRERYREAIVDALLSVWRGNWGSAWSSLALPAKTSPMTGGSPWAHRNGDEFLSIFDGDRMDERVAVAMKRQYPDGVYAYDAERTDRAIMQIGRSAREHGVEVVLFELPWPNLLERNWPPDVQADFRAALTRACNAAGLEWVPFESLGVEIDDRHFKEHSHLNLHGARRLTPGLVEQIIAPRFASDAASAP